MGCHQNETFKSVSVILFIFCIVNLDKLANAQRSLQHWKHDLEFKLKLYQYKKFEIEDTISSSIYSAYDDLSSGGQVVKVPSNGNVRFSDLIIPTGSIHLSSHVAPSTVRILVDKTQNYINSKANELLSIQDQLANIHRQLNDRTINYIYKGHRNQPQAIRNFSLVVGGTNIFKQVQFAQVLNSRNVTLPRINYTDVNRVIDDTYLRNLNFGVYDSQGRLFFEGKKTFWNSVFNKPLNSGCCNSLRPLHTNKMMLRSIDQEVRSPILIQSHGSSHKQPAIIRQLVSGQFFNKHIELKLERHNNPLRLLPGDIGLVESYLGENFIQLANLINVRQFFQQPQFLKTIVFQSPVVIEEALLSNSQDNRLVIGVSSLPGFNIDLSHDNYLLRYPIARRNHTPTVQKVFGKLIIEDFSAFFNGIDAASVNGIMGFSDFVREAVVQIDRPSVIHGPVQFNALPAMLNREPAQKNVIGEKQQSVLVFRVMNDMEVGTINGMRVPEDIVILPNKNAPQNERLALKPNQIIRIQGRRKFNQLIVRFSNVYGLVNGMQMPDGVIPLHLNDFMSSVGYSNLCFLDGISVNHMTIQSNQFDEINLRDVNGDAQSIVMRSTLLPQPDGSFLLRAPLVVNNLYLKNSGPNRGLLNGFRPQEVFELTDLNQHGIMYGRKRFLGPVYADDCVFSDINRIANWTNHLIRIDRPDIIQTVHTRLAFTAPPSTAPQPPYRDVFTEVNVERLLVEFFPDGNNAGHQSNWNFSPELYLLQQALLKQATNFTGGRYRVNHIRLIGKDGPIVNNIPLGDILTLDKPFRFADKFTLVGKVEVASVLRADRITSNYPVDAMDLVQFDKHRISLTGNSLAPIRLSNLILGQNNYANFVQCKMLNGITFNQFAQSIMSLTKPQDIYGSFGFSAPVSFEGLVRTQTSLNGIKNFAGFASQLKNARYSFEDGLQCNTVVVKT